MQINKNPSGDCALGGILTQVTTANQWGKVTYGQQGYISTNMTLLNHNVGGLGQIENEMIFTGADYIQCLGYGALAGDYINLGYTFQYLNHLYGITRPG